MKQRKLLAENKSDGSIVIFALVNGEYIYQYHIHIKGNKILTHHHKFPNIEMKEAEHQGKAKNYHHLEIALDVDKKGRKKNNK